MATFKERYEELFGPTPDYDPIDIDAPALEEGAHRRARAIEAGVPSASPRQALPIPIRDMGPPEEPQGAVSGLLKRGVGALGQGALGIPEYVARKMPDVPGMPAVAGTLEQGRINIEGWRQSIAERMNPEVMDMVGRELMTLDPDKTIWQGSPLEVAEAVSYKVLEQVPMMLATLVPGAVMMRAGAMGKGITYLGASEAGLSVGFIQNEIADGISEMNTEELMQESPRFAELMGDMDESEARTQLIQEAQGMAPLIGGLAVGAISAAAGRYLEPVITGAAGLSVGQRIGRGAISEGLIQEGPQESIETIAGNVAAAVYDGDRQALDNVVESYAQGALLGSIMGGGVAGLVGRSDTPADPTQEEDPALPAQALPFEDVFGTGGESPFIAPDAPPEAPGQYLDEAARRDAKERWRAGEDVEPQLFPPPVPDDVAAAISANLRGDDKMDDMIDNLAFGQQEQERYAQGRPTTPTQQTDMFPTAAPSQGPGVMVGPGGAPGQQEMFPGPEQRTFGNPPARMPDQPLPEPEIDISAQMDALERGERDGVYLAAGQTQVDTRGFPVVENFDGRGGAVVFADEKTARYAEAERDGGADMQELVGKITGAGTGKPLDGRLAVQQLDENGGVSRESLVGTEQEARALAEEWGGNTQILSAAEAVARRQQMAAGDLFAEPEPEPEVRGETTTERPSAESRGRFRVRFTDDAGQTLEDKTFSGQKRAEAYADQIADEYGLSAADADARVQLTPVRELPKQKTQPTQEEQAAVKRATAERDTKTEGEKTLEEVRRTTPMEDRPSPAEAQEIAKAETKQDVARRYVEQAATDLDKEQQRAIGGFFPPDAYDFNNPTNEARYRAVWDKLVELEVQSEMKGDIPLEKRGTVMSQNKRKRAELTKKLAQLRQIDKPKRRAQKKIEAAAKADKSTVRTLRRNASKIAQKIDTTTEELAELPEFSRAEVNDMGPLELDVAHEQAIQYLEGQDQRFEAEEHRKVRSPSLKRKLVLRAINKRRNKALTHSRVGGGRFATTSKQGVATESLTSVAYPADESKSAEMKRLTRAKAVFKQLAQMSRQALKRLKAIEVERDANGDLTNKGREQLLAKQYVEQTVQLAAAMIETGQTDLGSIQLGESIANMLGKIQTAGDLKLANLMGKQEKLMDEFVERRGGTEGRTAPKEPKKTRVQRVAEQNQKLAAFLKHRLRMDTLWPAEFGYRNIVRPILTKFSESYFSTKGYYKPSLEEAWELQWVADQWKNDPTKPDEQYYTPLRRALTQLGFSWDTNGKLVVKHTDGEFEYDPTESMLTNRAGLDSPMSLKRSDFETTPERGQSAEEFNKQREEAANRQAIDAVAKDSAATRQEATRHVRATTIMAAFRKVVDNSKSTINKLIDAERKMLADLSAEGFLPRNATTFAVIRVPGRADITYRRVASDLANRRITKAQARGRMRAITKKHVQEMATYRDKASATARDLTGTQTGDTSFEYVYDSQARADEIDMFGKGIEAAAGTVADLLNNRDGIVQHRVLLDAVIANLPESSFYGALARKLRAELLPAVEVSYDWGLGGRKLINNRTTTGRYYARDNSVVISRDNIGRMKNRPTALLHTLTHELVHAQTVASIHSNARLYQYVDELRRQAVEAVGGAEDLWYGFKNPEEFVAEAFSNPEFQTLLKSTPVDNETLWTKFTTFVKKILGFTDAPQFDNIFDALMAAEPQLIEQAGIKFDGGVYDNVLGAVAGKINDRMNLTNRIEQRARNDASKFWRGKVSHAISTMRQMRERYEKYFTDGSLKRYMSSFFARNAKNNELLQLPEKLSRKWTQLRDQNPDAEIDFSQIATESTLYSIDPSQSATHERNKKTAAAQKERYNDLRKRWKALPKEYQKLWSEVTSYYDSSMKSETKLLLLNAIRGVVTKGSGVTMDVDVFSKKYNEENISKFDTVEKIKDEFGEYLGSSESEIDNVVSLINRLATVPQMGQGVYFPLMRYGDYVVFASKDLPSEFFADSQAANARAAELRAEDPTLTVGVHKKGDGRYEVSKRESAFVTGESAYEVEQKRDDLKADFDVVGDVDLKSPEFEKKATIDSNAALASIISTLEGNAAAQQAIKQFYLRSLGDASFRKRELKRQNRAGVDYDLQHRNFANYAKQSAYYRSQLEYGWQMAKGMSDMNTFLRSRRAEQQPPALSGMSTEQLRNVYQTLQERDAMMTDPVQVNKVVRGGIALTQFYMLTSASYHIINSSQPWMVTLPTMGGRFGWGQAFTAMKEAQALIKDPIFGQVKESGGGFKMLPWLKNADTTAENAFGVFDQLTEKMKKDGGYDDVLEMLQSLRKTQVLEVSPLTELREMASGKTSSAAKALDASRVMAHLVEVNNRVLTAVAAYKLEYNKQLAEGVGPDTAKELATQYAERMVSQTQFDYSTANKPPVFMKYPLMFQFMQWSQHIYAHLIRNMAGTLRGNKEARSALLGVLGTHAMVGGIIGVALQPIKMAFGLAMMAFGDEDEPYTFKNAMSGATFDRSITAFTDDMFGTTVSTALTRGLPAALGADVSTRMSLGTLYFIDLRGDTPESVLGSLGSSFGGAFVNQMLTFGRGAQYIGSGDFAKAVESFSPKFLRDIVRAGRFATDGLVNNAGDQVLDTGDLGFVDVALQAVGFTPTTTSQFYQGQAAIKDAEGYVRQRKTRLLKEFRTAMPNDRAGIIRQVVEFNRAYPQEAITRSSLLRNLKSKYEREAQYSRYGAAIDDRKAQLYQGYGEPYR